MAEKVIAVMGATGAGKSSFIKLVTQNGDVKVGHGLASETQEIAAFPAVIAGCDLILVDTPGFDDTDRSDAQILQDLVNWLIETYKNGKKLSGIIYLHKITDTRVQGSTVRNLRVFRELCGNECFKKVALCVSFWNTEFESEEVLESRLRELTSKAGWWGSMVAGGSKVFNEIWTQSGAESMIQELVSGSEITLQVQREVVDERKTLKETSTFSTLLRLELERQEEEHQESIAIMKNEFEKQQQQFQRTHRSQSENLEEMRRELQRRQVETEELNRRLQRELNAKTVESMQSLERPATLAVDDASLFEEAVTKRHQRYMNFCRAVVAKVQHLENNRIFGNVKCDFNETRKSCYNMVCVNCLKNIGGQMLYKCIGCSQAPHEFILCGRCFENQSVHCNVRSHEKQNMIQGRTVTTGTHCPRVTNPPQGSRLLCSRCRKNVGQSYLHCCFCNEKFDMCIECATQRGRCFGHERTFGRTAHKLEICSRFIET